MRLSPPVPSRLQFGSGIVQWSSPALDFGAAMAEDFSHNLENILHRMKVEILKEHEHEVQIAKLRTKALLGAPAGEFCTKGMVEGLTSTSFLQHWVGPCWPSKSLEYHSDHAYPAYFNHCGGKSLRVQPILRQERRYDLWGAGRTASPPGAQDASAHENCGPGEETSGL